MQWIEVSVPTRSDEIDDVCAQLAELGAGGMVVEDEADFQDFLEHNHQYWDYVDDALEAQFRGVSRIKFYLSDDDDGRAQLETIRAGLGRELTTATVRDSDWENNWRQYYQPIEVGEKLVVVPEWLDAPADGRIALRLDPGLIFGTGSHPTTRMCLAALEQYAGAGKTVLQHAISKQADADVIIMVACGERANEVVEIFKEFPELIDPHTGHTLMERTIIICNTSNMPVAAREASVYTGMTIGEYYRSMGLKVLVMADSTSRWAQALREMSNRLEELPGQDAFPMDLSAIISNFYSRAGLVKLVGGQTGSVTFLGTVSPAGGNLKEPVTESTKKAARCFYALSQGRADSKRYPAIDPLESYSKYLEYPEIREYLDEHIEKDWVDLVYAGKTIVQRGKEANDQINILGDDGVPVEYHERFWKSELIDFVILQQDAFDDIDANCPMERQQMMYKMVLGICNQEFAFADFEACSQFFKGLINLFRQMNYSEWKSEKFEGYRKQIEQYVSEQSK